MAIKKLTDRELNQKLMESIGAKDPEVRKNFEELMNEKYAQIRAEVRQEVYEELSKQIGCSLDVIATLRERGFYDEYYCYIPPYRICRIDIFKKEIVYFDEEMDCFSVKFKDYKKTFWLKEDKSE